MSCGGCGVVDFGAALGTCVRCTSIAAASASVFWLFYAVAMDYGARGLITWPLLGFATLVTLVLLAHVLAHLARAFGK